MTVEELLYKLRDVHIDHYGKEIYLARDPEGNGYNPMTEFFVMDFDGDDVYDSGDGPDGSEKVVVFWP